jgi:hypothetical protein
LDLLNWNLRKNRCWNLNLNQRKNPRKNHYCFLNLNR